MKQMLTRGEARILQSQGMVLCVNEEHPANRRELRDSYRKMPRQIRKLVFGWGRKRWAWS